MLVWPDINWPAQSLASETQPSSTCGAFLPVGAVEGLVFWLVVGEDGAFPTLLPALGG